MSDFETAKELAQHIANIAPRGAVVSYVNNQVTVRLSQQANLHELRQTIVRNDEAFPTPRVEIDDKGRLNVYRSESEPVKAAQAETGADESAASFRPEAPSLNSLSHRLDVHRVLIRELRATAKEEHEERERVVKNLVESFDRLDEHVDEALDHVHERLDKGVAAFVKIYDRLGLLESNRSEDSQASLIRRAEDLIRRVEDLEKANMAFAPMQSMPHYPNVDTTPQWRGDAYSWQKKPMPFDDVTGGRPIAGQGEVYWRRYADELEAALRVARYDGEMQSEMKRGGN